MQLRNRLIYIYIIFIIFITLLLQIRTLLFNYKYLSLSLYLSPSGFERLGREACPHSHTHTLYNEEFARCFFSPVFYSGLSVIRRQNRIRYICACLCVCVCVYVCSSLMSADSAGLQKTQRARSRILDIARPTGIKKKKTTACAAATCKQLFGFCGGDQSGRKGGKFLKK